MPALTLAPDRLLPADPATRAIARELYAGVRDLPIISPHGHVPAQWLADDVPFSDPTSLLITPDHYVTRLMHTAGVDLDHLGVGRGPLQEADARAAWRTFCQHWPLYRGTPVRYWMESELVELFGVEVRPSAETADQIYDQIAGCLARDEYRPRALAERFGIDFLATTDDPCDDLAHHAKLAADASFTPHIAPTFRPDPYLEPARADWNQLIDRLAQVSGVTTDTWPGWVAAMENRRAHFKAHGAVSTDHSHRDLGTAVLEESEVERLYRAARAGQTSAAECTALRRHMVTEMARMACDDGLTMTLHPAVHRNHDTAAFARFGADIGGDIPLALEATDALAPLLQRFGNHPNFTLVLFTIDETVYSRELAPLAGWYRAVHLGVPWWFIDAPDAIGRFKRAVTETAGFSRLSGFIDDTRAFCSIPARHDMARRLDAAHLAQLVAEHRLDLDEAHEVAHQLVVDQPKRVFGL